MEQNVEKNDKSPTLVVSIDGSTIKSIRETKKLTQLYVASVVGVTTDTISRWENNRYPCIKRENAEKLAGALEVPLDDIIKADEPESLPTGTSETPPPSPRRPLVIFALAALLVLGVTGLLVLRQQASDVTVVRKLPRFSPPGEIMPVQLVVSATDPNESGLIVKDRLPPGWHLVNAEPAAAATHGESEEIKWLLPAGRGRRTISYTVRSPQSAAMNSKATFSGQFVIQSDGQSKSTPIGGELDVTLTDKHWADRNGDGKIDDNEIMPAYYKTEEMKGLGLDWKTIEKIWSSSGYRWDAEKHTIIIGR